MFYREQSGRINESNECISNYSSTYVIYSMPGKVLMPIGGKPMVTYQLERVRRSKRIDQVILATSTEGSDDKLVEVVENADLKFFVEI